MTTDTEALMRHAYHFAEGDVLDAQGFIDLFAEDSVFTAIGGVTGQDSYRGEHLGDVVTSGPPRPSWSWSRPAT